MGDQGVAVVRAQQQVLGAPVDGSTRRPSMRWANLARQRDTQVASALDEADDAPADELRDQAATDVLSTSAAQACS